MPNAIEPVLGTGGDDVIITGSGGQVISAGAGDDTAQSGSGHDEILGGSGDDILWGESGDDVLWGGGGPRYISLNQLTITESYTGQITFEGESAGYRNTLGSYTIDESGNITGVTFHFTNASASGSGGDLTPGVSSSAINLEAGQQVGFFIVANGYSINNSYQGLDFETGSLQFRDSEGNIANITDTNPSLWFVAADGTETQIQTNMYHSADGQESDFNLNPDGISHVVGLMSPGEGTIRLGFEDLYNGGDRDFDDCVFTFDLGQANTVITRDPNAPASTASDNDEIHGGTGQDEIHGRAGDDILYGDSGSDTIYGGSGDDIAYGGTSGDILQGNSGDDTLYGETGHDELSGGSGSDILYGGSGNDILNGASGDDYLDGGSGQDTLNGGSGDDIMYGGSSQDILNGGSGQDTLYGGSSQDTLSGGSSSDTIYGGSSSDTISGDSGNDILFGESGSDVISGGSGDDYISGGSGQDTLTGDSGNDIFESGTGRDSINGGSGSDTISYQAASRGVNIDLHGKRSTGGDSDTLISIENAIGSDFNDYVRGSVHDNIIDGGLGDDLIRGSKGNDTMTGGDGNDIFSWRESDLANYLDNITDFNETDDTLQFLLDSNLTLDNLSEWFNLVEVDGDTIIQIDRDGDGGQYSFTDYVSLDNTVGLDANQLDIDLIG